MPAFRSRLKSALGQAWTTWLRCVVRGKPIPRWGNLRRTVPFSDNFGSDRGTPVDRYYLHQFFETNAALITGKVLEIQLPGYTYKYGQDVTAAHSVDIDGGHNPTYHCDLAESEGVVPSNTYDCFLLPNTLSVLKDIEGCFRQALRVIKPGGVILASTGCFTPLVTAYPEYWHFTRQGWELIAERNWPGCQVEVRAHGNCLVAVAEMLQLSMEELRTAELEVQDPRYPVLITILCRKPA